MLSAALRCGMVCLSAKLWCTARAIYYFVSHLGTKSPLYFEELIDQIMHHFKACSLVYLSLVLIF